MSRRLPVRAWALVSFVCAATAGPVASQEERPAPVIYKWVDTNGIAHYTTNADDIPRELRSDLDTLRRQQRPGTVSQAPVDPDDPWAEVSVEHADDLWVVQDSPQPTDETGPDEPSSTQDGLDPAERKRLRSELAALDRQIATLQEQISADENVLKSWISNPDVDPVMAADDPEFRKVALRLPRLQGDLAKLEQKRRSMGGEPEEAAP